ncbi:hypothetical protein [Clostridium intestinale]|uniref:Lipoprotein n=1 Tax=Clostridium intestinale URNW TaxID=1294142 RepID=U2NIW7_9CLOT|nr:hypothetical protein [Clostridium intestinale]ERK28816.1 hypothetical protein CINTURNW_3927 [Clostridium intestinale URNW]
MFKNTLLKVLTISILISSLSLTSCTTEEKTITVQDDVQKMSNELDEDGRIFTKVRDLDIPEINGASIISVANDSSLICSRNILSSSDKFYNDISILNSDNSINYIENSVDFLDRDFDNDVITYFKDTELWSYDINTKEKKLLINIPEIKNDLKTYPHKISDTNYVSILSYIPYNEGSQNVIRILDLKTGKIYKSLPLKTIYISPNVFYSKTTNKFYTSSISSQGIYEFSLDDMNPNLILNVSISGNYAFQMSEDGNCIYLTKNDITNGDLYLSKFNLISRENIALLKISHEVNVDLSWINFDIIGDTIIYAFSSQRDDIQGPASYKSKLYTANISENSLTNTQLLYSTQNEDSTTLWFNLSEDGSRLLTTIYTILTSGQDKNDYSTITTKYTLYEKLN